MCQVKEMQSPYWFIICINNSVFKSLFGPDMLVSIKLPSTSHLSLLSEKKGGKQKSMILGNWIWYLFVDLQDFFLLFIRYTNRVKLYNVVVQIWIFCFIYMSRNYHTISNWNIMLEDFSLKQSCKSGNSY